LGDGTIRLRVRTEVSDTSPIKAVEIQGFEIPSIVARRAETTLEMKSGQTFGMAGLIQRAVRARTSRLPWIGDVPILGTLFSSVEYTKGESELVVLVTASLVEPMSVAVSDVPSPGAMHVTPNDWELYAEGRVEGRAPRVLSTTAAEWLRDAGLDRLVGPGAWVHYESLSPPTQTAQWSSVAPASGPQ
jgi:pilus assembly protein CpaC